MLFRRIGIEIMNSRTYLAFVIPLLALACDKDKRKKPSTDDTASTHDTGPEGGPDPDCDTGHLEDDGECVPAACGSGTWGNLEVDESTVYVNITAAEGGDGSEGAPFSSIQDGLDAAGDIDGGMVAVAAGTYPETLELDGGYHGVRLAGRCRELVSIDASGGGEDTPGIYANLGNSEVELSGVTVSGSQYIGVSVGSGVLRIRDSAVVGSGYVGVWACQHGAYDTLLSMEGCEVGGNSRGGVFALDSDTTVSLTETAIVDTLPDEKGDFGYGILVQDGANLDAEACEVARNSAIGVFVLDSGSSVALRETIIEDTKPDENGNGGMGIQVQDGASLDAEACVVRGNTNMGLSVNDPGTSAYIKETTIENTQPKASGGGGYGITINEEATLDVEGCEVNGNTGAGVVAVDPGTSVALRETAIEDTQPHEDGTKGYGLYVADGASLYAEGCEVRGNAAVGVKAYNSEEMHGTSIVLQETSIEETRAQADGEGGFGIEVSAGAALDAEACVVGWNANLGLAVYDSGTSVVLRETSVEDNQPLASLAGGIGVQVCEGASLVAESCGIKRNTAVGLLAAHSGTSVTLRETAIKDNLSGGYGAAGFGIQLYDGANLEAEGGEVVGNVSAGLVADGPGTSATLRETKFASTTTGEIFTSGMGIVVQAFASVVATGIEVSSNQGPGLYATEKHTLISCSDCTIRDNQFAGTVVVAGASLQLADSIIEGTVAQENLGGAIGLYAAPWVGRPPTLSVTGTTIQDNAIAGVWLSGQGSYSLSGNTIHGGEGWSRESLTKCGDAVYARDGVTAWDGSSGLLLENNELLDGLGSGLFLDNASATLSGNSYVDNAVDLVVQGSGCEAPPDGYEDALLGSAELCPTYDYATCGDEFSLYLTLAEPETGYGAAFMSPGLPGPGELHLPMLPTALPHAFEPLPLLPPAPRLEPLKLRLEPLRHAPAPPVPFVAPRER